MQQQFLKMAIHLQLSTVLLMLILKQLVAQLMHFLIHPKVLLLVLPSMRLLVGKINVIKKVAQKKKKCTDLAIVDFLNEVTVKHAQEKQACTGKSTRKGYFEEIAKEFRALRNISDSIKILKRSIDRRLQTENLAIGNVNSGEESPMSPYEDYFVDMII